MCTSNIYIYVLTSDIHMEFSIVQCEASTVFYLLIIYRHSTHSRLVIDNLGYQHFTELFYCSGAGWVNFTEVNSQEAYRATV